MIDIRETFQENGSALLWDSTKDDASKLKKINDAIHAGFESYFMVLCLESNACYHKSKLKYLKNSTHEPFGKNFSLSFAKSSSPDKIMNDRVILEERVGEEILVVKHYYKDGEDEYFDKSYYVVPYKMDEEYGEQKNLRHAKELLWNGGFYDGKISIEDAVDKILKACWVH